MKQVLKRLLYAMVMAAIVSVGSVFILLSVPVYVMFWIATDRNLFNESKLMQVLETLCQKVNVLFWGE